MWIDRSGISPCRGSQIWIVDKWMAKCGYGAPLARGIHIHSTAPGGPFGVFLVEAMRSVEMVGTAIARISLSSHFADLPC